MSQGSRASFGTRKNCHCGMAASQLIATTPINAGRRFSKCSKTKDKRCQFWEWNDVLLDSRIADFISSLKCEKDALKREKIGLQAKVAKLENILAMNVHDEDDDDGGIELEGGHIPVYCTVGGRVKVNKVRLNKWVMLLWQLR